MRCLQLLCAAALAAALAGCQSVECADGTFRDGDTCVGYDPNDKTPPVTMLTPAGGRSREPIPEVVMLMTDEPARVYFTTDGSDPDPATQPGEISPVAVTGVEQGTTLRYFAIDRAGNREEIGAVTFESDTTPPAPVTGMTASITGTTVTVTWTNPTDADYAGTVIARVADAIDAEPMPGQLYTGPAALSPSLQIVAVGNATQFVDASRPAGPVRYVAWTHDDVGNYGLPVSVRDEIPLGSLTAQLGFANNTLTTSQAPADLDLAGTTATLSGSTLTLSLSVKNNSSRYFQNMKAEVTSVSGGTFSNSDGTADSFPFKSLGPNLVAPNATVTRELTFTNVAAATPVTINLTFAHHPSMIGTAGRNVQNLHVIDLGSSAITPFFATSARGPNDRANGRVRPSVLTGGRYLDIPTTHGAIERWDLVTRMPVLTARLGEEAVRINVQGLYASPSHTFAVVKHGGRTQAAPAELVRLDEGLRVTARLALPNDNRGFALPVFSPDFTVLAIPLQAGIALVDTQTMTQLDADPATPAVDLFVPGFTERIRAVQFFDGPNGLAVLARNNGRAAFIRRTPDGYTVTPYQDATTNAKAFSIVTNTDGKIWMAFASGLRVFDPATGNVSNITYAQTPNGLAVVDGKLWVIRSDRITLDQISSTGSVQRTITLPAGTGIHGHWLQIAR